MYTPRDLSLFNFVIENFDKIETKDKTVKQDLRWVRITKKGFNKSWLLSKTTGRSNFLYTASSSNEPSKSRVNNSILGELMLKCIAKLTETNENR